MRRIWILVIAIFVFCAALVGQFYMQGLKAKKLMEEQRFLRLQAEEDLQKVKIEVSSVTTELDRIKKKAENLESVVSETKALNDDLKKQISDLSDQKNSLEQRVDQAIDQMQNNVPVQQQ